MVVQCPICKGKGEVSPGFYSDGTKKCKACDGKGIVFDNGPNCPVPYPVPICPQPYIPIYPTTYYPKPFLPWDYTIYY
jgi:hypothetical protein